MESQSIMVFFCNVALVNQVNLYCSKLYKLSQCFQYACTYIEMTDPQQLESVTVS